MSTRIFGGWYVVAACFFCLMLAGGIGWFTFPVFLKPLENEFGWTRTQLMTGIGIWAGVTGIFSPILGHFIDRWRAQRIMLAGVAGMGLATLLLGEIHSLGHLYGLLLLVGLSTTACTYLPVASVVSQWFVRRRGLAMSIAMMGMGVGGFIMPNISNALIELAGWRWAYRVFALILWILLLPVIALFVHGKPSDVGLNPDGDEKITEDPAAGDKFSVGFGAGQALRMLSFWGMGIADLAAAIAIVGIEAQMVAFSIEAGIENEVAAFAYSLIRLAMVLAMIGVGMAADRFSKRMMISLSYGLPGMAVFLLFGLTSATPLFAFAILSGICGAGRAAIWPLVVSDCFGKRAYATVMGFLFIFWTAGTIAGPPIAGLIFDSTHSYYWVFITSIFAFAIAGISMAIGAKPRLNHELSAKNYGP